ncbi:MAG: C25 family cysteine peptidase [Nitrospiria bacterium]
MRLIKKKLIFSFVLGCLFIYGCSGGGGGGQTVGEIPPPPPPPGCGSYTALNSASKLKINVKSNGIYIISPSILSQFCFDSSGINLHNFKIQNFNPAANSKIFVDIPVNYDVQGNVEFYGVGVNRNDYTAPNANYTETNVYWLVPGTPVKMATKANASPSTPATAMTTLHMETNNVYWPNLVNGSTYDHWFWAPDLANGQTFIYNGLGFQNNFYLSNYDSTFGNQIGLSVYFHADNPAQSTTETHNLSLSFNATPLTPASWSVSSAQTNLPFYYHANFQHALNTYPSPNSLSITTNDTSVAGVYLNWFELEYPVMANQDQVVFHGNILSSGNYTFAINGFTQNQVEIFDITNPANPQLIPAPNISYVLSGSGYQVVFNDDLSYPNNYIALTPAQRMVPGNASISIANSVNLTGVSGNYDYLIITHENFYSNVQPLSSYRGTSAGGSHLVKTVKMTDVYDSYSGGIFTPQAIKDFLIQAKSSTMTNLQYVLLVGDASLDYKNYQNYGQENFVPTYLIDYSFGQTPSDYWFVQNSICNSNVSTCAPTLAIGRLPAKTGTEADTMVNKIINYETVNKPSVASWNKNIIFVSGSDSDSTFDTDSGTLASLIPSGGGYQAINDFYSSAPAGMTTTILSSINSGALVTNYMGHGSVGFWANCVSGQCTNLFFQTTPIVNDVTSLNNSAMLTFLVTLDCLNGMFAGSGEGQMNPLTQTFNPYSVAETFLKSSMGGAVGSFSPTGQGYSTSHMNLASQLYPVLLQSGAPPVGIVIQQVEGTILQTTASPTDLETVQIFVLLGDPATRLILPY